MHCHSRCARLSRLSGRSVYTVAAASLAAAHLLCRDRTPRYRIIQSSCGRVLFSTRHQTAKHSVLSDAEPSTVHEPRSQRPIALGRLAGMSGAWCRLSGSTCPFQPPGMHRHPPTGRPEMRAFRSWRNEENASALSSFLIAGSHGIICSCETHRPRPPRRACRCAARQRDRPTGAGRGMTT